MSTVYCSHCNRPVLQGEDSCLHCPNESSLRRDGSLNPVSRDPLVLFEPIMFGIIHEWLVENMPRALELCPYKTSAPSKHAERVGEIAHAYWHCVETDHWPEGFFPADAIRDLLSLLRVDGAIKGVTA